MSTYLGDVVRSNRCGRYRLSRWQVPESRLAKEANKMTRISIPHSIRTEKGDQRKLVQSQFRVYFFGRKGKKIKIKFSGVSIFWEYAKLTSSSWSTSTSWSLKVPSLCCQPRHVLTLYALRSTYKFSRLISFLLRIVERIWFKIKAFSHRWSI